MTAYLADIELPDCSSQMIEYVKEEPMEFEERDDNSLNVCEGTTVPNANLELGKKI